MHIPDGFIDGGTSLGAGVIATGTVYWSGRWRRMYGQKKPFHVPWNWRIATAASAGPASGSITNRKVVK